MEKSALGLQILKQFTGTFHQAQIMKYWEELCDGWCNFIHLSHDSIYLGKYYFDILFWKKIGRSQLTSPANNFYEEFWYQLIKKSKDCVKDVSYHPYHYHDKDFTTINFKEFRIYSLYSFLYPQRVRGITMYFRT